jgi:hypothetical protein
MLFARPGHAAEPALFPHMLKHEKTQDQKASQKDCGAHHNSEEFQNRLSVGILGRKAAFNFFF